MIEEYQIRVLPEQAASEQGIRQYLQEEKGLADAEVTAVRVWSGEYLVQDTTTPAPYNKPYRLISIPFYYVGQLDKILRKCVV